SPRLARRCGRRSARLTPQSTPSISTACNTARTSAIGRWRRAEAEPPQAASASIESIAPLSMDTSRVHDYFVDLQARIVARLEAIDGQPFRRDAWKRAAGGEGVTCVIEEGNVFERGGVNFSHVKGDRLPPSASAARPQLSGRGFEVMGVSLVLHPRNPYAPTVHMSVRLFVA